MSFCHPSSLTFVLMKVLRVPAGKLMDENDYDVSRVLLLRAHCTVRL